LAVRPPEEDLPAEALPDAPDLPALAEDPPVLVRPVAVPEVLPELPDPRV
jgi:hypothetical protein